MLIIEEWSDHGIEVTSENVTQSVNGESDAMIGDPILFEIVGANFLTAATTAELGTPLR